MELLYAVPAAIGLGALHSLEPGHGKGVLTAYLISSRAKTKDAILLGFISALSHTLSIVLLAFTASSAIKFMVPAHLVHWIELLSGVAITIVGTRIFYQQAFPKVVVLGLIGHRHNETLEHHHHGHHHHHHNHGHRAHEVPTSLSRLFSVGFFTGLIPCPSALTILLAAIAEDRIPSGMGLVAAFSAGSAIAMIAIGILVVKTGTAFARLERQRATQSMAVLSSLFITGIGIFVMYQAYKHLVALQGM